MAGKGKYLASFTVPSNDNGKKKYLNCGRTWEGKYSLSILRPRVKGKDGKFAGGVVGEERAELIKAFTDWLDGAEGVFYNLNWFQDNEEPRVVEDDVPF